ncbi:hypothetical protein N7493_001532 [Penicillium malachiteum]|uniref:Vacuolar ATPase assembly protein VMA22 n=1 Tax=Penicillium malachiteum TaxID=1324776 RepID=A0AAD6MZX9_9EURO|nr:hypothetical protein N7493_001532 [Penicillium malachiteum]
MSSVELEVTASKESLQSLDTLLERYLQLLDRQQQMQSELAKEMSSGFLSLAHANYLCPPGRRYGADYYDERMKANQRISIREAPENDEVEYQFLLDSITQHLPDKPTEIQLESPIPKFPQNAGTSHLELHTTGNDDLPGDDPNVSRSSLEEEKKKERPKKFQSDDPIYWYGVLVPSSLRTAQKAFAGGIRRQVPELAAVTVEMRGLEQKIRHLRTKLDLVS